MEETPTKGGGTAGRALREIPPGGAEPRFPRCWVFGPTGETPASQTHATGQGQGAGEAPR